MTNKEKHILRIQIATNIMLAEAEALKPTLGRISEIEKINIGRSKFTFRCHFVKHNKTTRMITVQTNLQDGAVRATITNEDLSTMEEYLKTVNGKPVS